MHRRGVGGNRPENGTRWNWALSACSDSGLYTGQEGQHWKVFSAVMWLILYLFKKITVFIYFWLCWVLVAARAFL